MVNLHERYNHYLNTDKLLSDHDVNERLITYGWLDNGKDLTGYFLLTENYELRYDIKGVFKTKVPRKSLAATRKWRGVAQFGRALALGASGRRFKSYHPDYIKENKRNV